MKVSKIIQKLKPGQKAKDFAYALPHVGAGIVFASAVAMVAMQIASHFSEKAGEMMGKLGSEKLFYFTAIVGALTAIAGIAYFALYLTKKIDKQLEVGNQQLSERNLQLEVGNQQLSERNLQLEVDKQQLSGRNLQLENDVKRKESFINNLRSKVENAPTGTILSNVILIQEGELQLVS